MIKLKIEALGTAIPKNTVEYKGGIRHRISENETHLSLLTESAKIALDKADMSINDIDLILGGCAVGLQPIPCTASLIHEQLKPERNIPAFDVNSTCTSFLTALEIAGNYIELGKYKNILIISGDVASIALNENERHSYELFGDGAVSAVVSKTDDDCGIIYSKQVTDSSGAHLTEIVGGLSALSSWDFTEDIKEKYKFHMEGKSALVTGARVAGELLEDMNKNSGLSLQDIKLIVPHQASPALALIMRKIGIPTDKYIDIVKEYGNMVSASVPFALAVAIERKQVTRGDIIALMGTAAGLTGNAIILKY